MTKPKDKNKKKKFRKTAKGKSKTYYTKAKKAKHKCALCEKVLQGVPHSKNPGKITKLSRTKRRPSVVFGGILCGNCRTKIVDEAVKVSQKEKKEEELEIKSKKFVEQMKGMIK